MPDRKDALTELLAKVEAGTLWRGDVKRVTDLKLNKHLVFQSNHGSLDAAKALHEAVLGVGFNYSIHKDSASVMTWAHTVEGKTINAINANPARAWLIAILKALISESNHVPAPTEDE
jgi:hypothetical protein